MECSTANGVQQPCTVIYRTEHWNVPDYIPWGVPLGFLYENRFVELLLHNPGEGFLLGLLASLLTPLRWGFSKFVGSCIKRKLQLGKFNMAPEHSFLQEMSSCLFSMVPKDFYNRVEKGSLKLKKAHSFSFCKDGVLIDGELEPQMADLVILATGFRAVEKLKNIIVSPHISEVHS